MGFVKSRIRHLFTKYKLDQKIHYVGRKRAAAPATGIAKRHNTNQTLIKQISLQAPLKRVIKERAGVSFMKFKKSTKRLMANIKVPELGESIIEGTLTSWLISEGSSFNVGDNLAEIETEKITIEIPAQSSELFLKF